MLNVRLASGHLYGKQLFTWLSLVVSLMAYFVLSFFPLGVLGGIWVGWLVGCFGFNGPLGQYFSLYRTVSQREGGKGEK